MHRPFLAFLLLLSHAAGQGVLTRAIDIRTLPYERSLEKLPADLEATIGFVESSGTVFVQDDSAGTHLHFKPTRSDLRAGDKVRIKGLTVPGLYLPGLDVTDLQILGHGPPPAPVKATYDDLATGRFHYQRVTVEGLGRTLTPLDENRSLLRLALGGRVIEVRVDSPRESAPSLVDARLRITALAAGSINDRRQLVLPYLRVTGWEDVIVIEAPRALASLPEMPLGNLLRFGAPDEASQRVRVRGTILAAFADGRLFLRSYEQTAGSEGPPARVAKTLGVRLINPALLSAGETVEIAGFPTMDRFSATLADAEVISSTAATPDTLADAMPQEVLPKRIFSGDHDCDLISLRASIADTYRSSSGIELRLRLDGFSIQAILPFPVATMPEIGSTVLVTGICQVESSTDKGFRSQPERATLLLRDASDLRVLQAPGFWTARRLAMATALLGAVILLGLIWITLLRRQVAKQSTALRERIAHEAALEERQRIAREFHDTLEQELAGLSLRLDAATTRPLEDKARSLLDASRHLVSRIQSEARNLVADLRTNPDDSADLSAALRELAARSPVHDHLALQVHVEEPIPPLPAHVVHHLRMMAQEAVTNALKHAQASVITIGLRVEDARLRLSIQDNGRGLDAAATQGTPGHFGCMGMRERCLRIHAEVAWQSQPGQGTTVTVTLPLNLKPELRVHG